jgi:hypothetical protein
VLYADAEPATRELVDTCEIHHCFPLRNP